MHLQSVYGDKHAKADQAAEEVRYSVPLLIRSCRRGGGETPLVLLNEGGSLGHWEVPGSLWSQASATLCQKTLRWSSDA